ncbi:hypothetical protein HDU97_007413 [Phlyctochytrium planicorne]|nr:hypothetical protein HDU97_007413 [Phlyctochytrium planicorne]
MRLSEHPLFLIPDIAQHTIPCLKTVQDFNAFTIAFPTLRGLFSPNLVLNLWTSKSTNRIRDIKKLLNEVHLPAFLIHRRHAKQSEQLAVPQAVRYRLALVCIREIMDSNEHFCFGCFPDFLQGNLWNVVEKVMEEYPALGDPKQLQNHTSTNAFANIRTLMPKQWQKILDWNISTPTEALFHAAEYSAKAVRFFLSRGADADLKTIQAAMYSACLKGNRCIHDVFVQHGIETIGALDIAVGQQDLSTEIVERYSQRHSSKLNLSLASDALLQAIHDSTLACFRMIIKNTDMAVPDGKFPCLVTATMTYCPELICLTSSDNLFDLILESGLICEHQPLQPAVICGHVHKARRLMDLGMEPYPKILHDALTSSSIDMIKLCTTAARSRPWFIESISQALTSVFDLERQWRLVDAFFSQSEKGSASKAVDLVLKMLCKAEDADGTVLNYLTELGKDLMLGTQNRFGFLREPTDN